MDTRPEHCTAVAYTCINENNKVSTVINVTVLDDLHVNIIGKTSCNNVLRRHLCNRMQQLICVSISALSLYSLVSFYQLVSAFSQHTRKSSKQRLSSKSFSLTLAWLSSGIINSIIFCLLCWLSLWKVLQCVEWPSEIKILHPWGLGSIFIRDGAHWQQNRHLLYDLIAKDSKISQQDQNNNGEALTKELKSTRKKKGRTGWLQRTEYSEELWKKTSCS